MRIENDVLAVLSRAETNGAALVLTGQLDRKLYERTNKVLEAAGGKWNRKAKAHVFDGDASDRMEQIIISGEVEIPKDEYNFFPTPYPVVARLMELADMHDGFRVLEPSAGKGAIAHACVERGAIVDCHELMEANYQWLVDSEEFGAVVKGDFLEVTPSPVYHRVVMNPPFMKQADIKHVSHALKFLRPSGLLVSVMASGVMFRENKLTVDFRNLVDERGGFFEALPDAAFKDSGTMVSTVIAVVPA